MTIDPARENLDWYFANAARVQWPLGIEAMGGGREIRKLETTSSSLKIRYPFSGPAIWGMQEIGPARYPRFAA